MLEYTGPGFDTARPDYFKDVTEGQPGIMLGRHPALAMSKLRAATKAEIGDLYRAFTGKEPPKSVAEWKARILAEGRELPKYAEHLQDDVPNAD